MKNDLFSKKIISKSHVVYKTNCTIEDCELQNSYYIGYTQCTINERMMNHTQNGSMNLHHREHHDINPKNDQLLEYTKTLYSCKDANKLKIFEALSILLQNPAHNRQQDQFGNVLQLYQTLPTNEWILQDQQEHGVLPSAAEGAAPSQRSPFRRRHSYRLRNDR